MFLRCPLWIDDRYTFLTYTTFVQFVSCLHPSSYIHKCYCVVLLSTKRIVDFLTKPLGYAIINAPLNDIITEMGMRKRNYPFDNRFLIQLLFTFDSFAFNPTFLFFVLFKPCIVILIESQFQVSYLLFKKRQHLMFRPCWV